MQRNISKIIKSIVFVILLIVPILIILTPIDFWASGDSLCISKRIFNAECYGCGMTRALLNILHLNFEEAVKLNKLSFLVFPVLIMLWVKLLLSQINVKIFKWF